MCQCRLTRIRPVLECIISTFRMQRCYLDVLSGQVFQWEGDCDWICKACKSGRILFYIITILVIYIFLNIQVDIPYDFCALTKLVCEDSLFSTCNITYLDIACMKYNINTSARSYDCFVLWCNISGILLCIINLLKSVNSYFNVSIVNHNFR